jgi:tetratricopeptide (TPR) repeat protein
MVEDKIGATIDPPTRGRANDRPPRTTDQPSRTERPSARRHISRDQPDEPDEREILRRARRAFEKGADEEALMGLDCVLGRGARYADVYYMLGMIRERRDEPDGAVAALREATRINPAYTEALLALASLLERQGDFEQARILAERANQLARPVAGGLDAVTNGRLANQQAEFADALAACGQRHDAIAQYRGALKRCPAYHDIRHRLAVSLREAGLPAQAIREFQRILANHPGMLESRTQLGLTYYAIGRTAQAIREWEAALEEDPAHKEAQTYLRLGRGQRVSSGPERKRARSTAPAATWRTTPLHDGGSS